MWMSVKGTLFSNIWLLLMTGLRFKQFYSRTSMFSWLKWCWNHEKATVSAIFPDWIHTEMTKLVFIVYLQKGLNHLFVWVAERLCACGSVCLRVCLRRRLRAYGLMLCLMWTFLVCAFHTRRAGWSAFLAATSPSSAVITFTSGCLLTSTTLHLLPLRPLFITRPLLSSWTLYRLTFKQN